MTEKQFNESDDSMSILKILELMYRQCCINCVHIDILPDEPHSTRWDCFCPDFIWSGENKDYEWYWNAFQPNNCRHFKRKELNEWDREDWK